MNAHANTRNIRARQNALASSDASGAGFTLIEILVALVISAVIVLGARALLESIGDTSARIHRAALSADSLATGDEILRTLVGRIEIGTRAERGFAGDEHSAEFWSWCEVPDGWLEQCQVRLEISTEDSTHDLTIDTQVSGRANAPPVSLRSTGYPLELRYLNSASGGGDWFTAWGRGITAPLAIAIVSPSDTAIIAIGERG
jgi:prepilin-type N-terminal cleavage/methylation domain-containing protein